MKNNYILILMVLYKRRNPFLKANKIHNQLVLNFENIFDLNKYQRMNHRNQFFLMISKTTTYIQSKNKIQIL